MNIIVLDYDVITGSRYKLVKVAEIYTSQNTPHNVKLNSLGVGANKRHGQRVVYASNSAQNRERLQSAALLMSKQTQK